MLTLVMGLPAAAGAATVTALTCNNTNANPHVSDAEAAATAGDTVLIPAGSCTWTKQLAPTQRLTITGSGTLATIIMDGMTKGTAEAGILLRWNVPNTGLSTLSNIEFIGTSTPSSSVGMIWFENTATSTVRITGNRFWTTEEKAVVFRNKGALFDHNDCRLQGPSRGNWCLDFKNGGGSYGDESWAAPDNFTTAADNVVVEDNAWSCDPCDNGASTSIRYAFATDGIDGGRAIIRYNTFTNTPVATHGLDTGGRSRSMRSTVVYRNAFIVNNGANITPFNGHRGGAGRWFENTLTLSGGSVVTDLVGLNHLRSFDTSVRAWTYWGGQTAAHTMTGLAQVAGVATATFASEHYWELTGLAPPAEQCNYALISGASPAAYNGVKAVTRTSATQFTFAIAAGTASPATGTIIASSPFNENNGTVPTDPTNGHMALDQPGAGQGDLIGKTGACDGPTPVSYPNIQASPVLAYYNLKDSVLNHASSGAPVVLETRDFFNEKAGQIVRGLHSARPSAVGCGTKYYVSTDQGTWNTATTGSTLRVTWAGIQGVVFKCVADAWVTFEEPLVYPHPNNVSSAAPASPASAVGRLGTRFPRP